MKLSNKGSYGIAIEDLPIILHTIVFYVTLIGTGFFQCALGAGLPELSEKMNQSTNSLGILFTARGVGYFIGSVLSTTQVEWKILKLSEPLIVSISALICAIGSIILASVTNFVVLCIIVLVQGAFFAVVEPIAQVYMIEVWGERIEVSTSEIRIYFIT
jgi:fucose permease